MGAATGTSQRPGTLVFSLAGTALSLTVDRPAVSAYAADRLRGLAVDTRSEPSIASLLVVQGARQALRRLRETVPSAGASRRMSLDVDRLFAPQIAPLSGLTLAWGRDGAAITQTTVLADGLGAQYVKRLARRLSADFFVDQLVQFGGLFPLLYAAEQHGWAPLHAALVDTPRGAVLIAGGAGAGKSTLAVGLSTRLGNRLLADNLALTDGAGALGVPEPVKLDSWSARAVGETAAVAARGGGDAGWGRREYEPPAASGPVKPALIVLPRLAGAAAIDAVEPARAASALAAGAMLAFEIQTYYRYAAAVASADSMAPPPRRDGCVSRLAADNPVVALAVVRGQPLTASLDLIERRLERR
jgi:hypothetical protein